MNSNTGWRTTRLPPIAYCDKEVLWAQRCWSCTSAMDDVGAAIASLASHCRRDTRSRRGVRDGSYGRDEAWAPAAILRVETRSVATRHGVAHFRPWSVALYGRNWLNAGGLLGDPARRPLFCPAGAYLDAMIGATCSRRADMAVPGEDSLTLSWQIRHRVGDCMMCFSGFRLQLILQLPLAPSISKSPVVGIYAFAVEPE